MLEITEIKELPELTNQVERRVDNFPVRRPGIDDDIRKEAALETARNTCNLKPTDIARLAEAILEKYSLSMDGFQLAKELDRDGWDVNLMFVEDMDQMDGNVREAHQKKCYKWVKDNDIQPALSIGTELKQGIIKGFSIYSPAAYEVKVHGHDDSKNGKRRLIINYEDAIVIGDHDA